MSIARSFKLCGIAVVIAGAIMAAIKWQETNSTSWAGNNASQPALKEALNVNVKVFNDKGELVGPVRSHKVRKTDEQWKEQLTAEQFYIAREHGTERAFTGKLLDNKDEGVYTCVACGLPLYDQSAKFDSGTGWPSFFQAIADENVGETRDESAGMLRVEIHCARCDSHLGHVFPDGPKPTGQRHCVNAASLSFTPRNEVATLADAATQMEVVVLAGGCFWCTEAVFEQLQGVNEVVSGYAGGDEKDANYRAVCTGQTAHAEVIRITYDPSVIELRKILEIFMTIAHNPTQLNAQGPDRGRQYRSAIFFANEYQRQTAEDVIRKLRKIRYYKRKIVTTLEPLTVFYEAEAHHQDYVRLHPKELYVRAEAMPKVQKLRQKFAGIVKPREK